MTDESTTGDAESPGTDATEPIDPARPAETDAPDSAQPPTGGAPARSDGAGVTIPSWLAGALVVVLALLIAGAGFAIGRATAPDDERQFRPAVATESGRRGGSEGFPLPGGPGGPGGLPGFPGEGRGGDGEGPRVFPGERDRGSEQDDRRDDDGGSEPDDDDSSDAPAPPQLPGT